MTSSNMSWLRRKEASRLLKEKYNISRTPGTLAKLACLGGGPKFQYVGRIPMYRADVLDEWAQAQFSVPFASTSQKKNDITLMDAQGVSYE